MFAATLAWAALAITCPQEQDRVRQHLEGAWVQLTTVEPAGLSPTQRTARAKALEVLREYIDRGEFPSNPGLPLTPIFVDDQGVRCAMGEVLERLGATAIVRHIHETRNLATIGQLADEPGLVPWLLAHGLTPEEAALVQPSYWACGPRRLASVCGGRRSTEVTSAGRARSFDGGVTELERFFGIGEAPPLRRFYSRESNRISSWPDGTVYLWSQGDWRRYLVRRGSDFVAPVDLKCGRAPAIPEALARRLISAPKSACERALLDLDPRWALYTCVDDTLELSQFSYDLCSDSGGLVAADVRSRADAQQWLDENGHADAGVDLSGYESWVTEQPGPPPITLEAPPALPLPSGCSQTPGLLSLAALLVSRRRRAPMPWGEP